MFNNDPKIRRLQLEQQSDDNLLRRRIEGLNAVAVETSDTGTTNLPPIIQMLRNTDCSHSVETWWHANPSAGDQNYEAAGIYTHVAPNPKIVNDAITTEDDKNLFSASANFTAGDAGSSIIIDGAGPDGAKLVTTISEYVAADHIRLDDAPGASLTNARARWNLQKLERVNSIVAPVSIENDALKSDAHTDYESNISDPDWKRDTGIVRLGSTNTIDFFLGTYADDGITWRPSIYGISAGRDLFFICKLVKAHAGVKVRGHFYVGLYNNDDRNLEYLSGSGFEVAAQVAGTPAATATTKYLIVARTDRGYTYFTQVLTVPNAPAVNSYIPNQVQVLLSWSPRIPAASTYTIYRQIDGGNVEKIGIVPNSDTNFTDNNPIDRISTGTTVFPTQAADNTLKAYIATVLNDFDDIALDGSPYEDLRLQIPMPASINLSEATEIVLRAGLTEPLSLEISDAINAGANISSASGFFDAAKHVGKSAILTNLANISQTLSTEVASVSDANNLVLSDAPGWDGTNRLEILDGEPHGLYLDLFGLSLNQGIWSPHPEDNNRPQLPAALPNGSTQGGIEIGGSGTGGGGIDCFAWYGVLTDFETGTEFLANELQPKMRLFNGSPNPSIVRKVKRAIVYEAFVRETIGGHRSVPLTQHHRSICGFDNLRHGTPVRCQKIGGNLLRFSENDFMIDEIKSVVPVKFHEGLLVISIELEESETDLHSRTFLLDGTLEHNNKSPQIESPQTSF